MRQTNRKYNILSNCILAAFNTNCFLERNSKKKLMEILETKLNQIFLKKTKFQ